MKILFHIGLHKTGTTYLQSVVFPQLFAHEHYHFKKKAVKALYYKSFKKDKLNVFSEENWSNSIIRPEDGWNNFSKFIDNLHHLNSNFDVRFIIVLRKHIGYVWSAYLHELKMGRKLNMSFEEYINSFGEKGLSWSARIESLKEYKLLALDYQDMQGDTLKFINRIADFAGAPSKFNLSSSKGAYNINPKTEPEMFACQRFENVYQFIYKNLKSAIGIKLPTEGLRVKIRDMVIRFVGNKTSNAQIIEMPTLPQEINDTFDADWKSAWSIYNNCCNRIN